jgi:hypothetical protein
MPVLMKLNQFIIKTNVMEQIKSIQIIGKRWFDRVNGNTYFSAVGLVDGKEAVKIDYEYGYSDHYVDRIFQELEKAGFVSDVEHYSNGSQERFWQYCQRKGIEKYTSVSDVRRKKDL